MESDGRTTAEVLLRSFEASHPASALTARERQVAQLILEGCISRDIAAQLGISVRTVEVHRLRVNHKLGSLRGAASVQRKARVPTERVYLDDISYEPQPFVDLLSVTFVSTD